MSKIRQSPVVRVSAIGFHGEYTWRERHSDWGQLIWASRGTIDVMVERALWLVPTRTALWLPPGTANDVHMTGRGVLRLVFIDRRRARALGPTPRVRVLTPLLRELLRRVTAMDTLSAEVPRDMRLLGVLLDELRDAGGAPVDLPMPADARALRAATFFRERTSEPPALADTARHAGASVRTLERLFRAETGLSLGAWCRRARLMHAMTRLADGESVTRAGIAAGYASTSAFVHAFRRLTGRTPGQSTSATPKS